MASGLISAMRAAIRRDERVAEAYLGRDAGDEQVAAAGSGDADG